MLRTMFRVLFKVMLALGTVFAALAIFRYFYGQKADYIEIYNDEDDDFLEEYE